MFIDANEDFENVNLCFRQKYPVVSHFKMLKHSLEQRSLAWHPGCHATTTIPFRCGSQIIYV